jgi:hypothetical protein
LYSFTGSFLPAVVTSNLGCSVHFQQLEITKEASLQRLLAAVEMRLAVVTEAKADLEAGFLKLKELRQQVRKADLGGPKKTGAGPKPDQAHRRTAACASRPPA